MLIRSFNLVDLTNAAGDDVTPAWSPTSVGKIAFASNRKGQFEIYTMATSGASVLALTNDKADRPGAELVARREQAHLLE